MSQVSSGWLAVDETWTRVSNTTFTIAGDKTDKYQKGDKIKLTQTTVKYFYVIGVSYSSPNTTITVTGGSDYSLANATITEPYFSKIENPQGHPIWFNWTPTFTQIAGSMTYTGVTVPLATMRIIGGYCEINMISIGTIGGTVGVSLYFQPLLRLNKSFSNHSFGSAIGIRNNGGKVGMLANNEDNFYAQEYSGNNWVLGANQQIRIAGLKYPY